MLQLDDHDGCGVYLTLNPQHRCKVGKVLQLFSKIIPHIKVKKNTNMKGTDKKTQS